MNENKKTELLTSIAEQLKMKSIHVKQVIQLVEEGNTIPFIARYRKEMTGGLDEVQIRDIIERWTYGMNLLERKEEVLRLIHEQGKLTDELQTKILRAKKLQEVEDLYRPFRQKRRTRATVAKEKGLEPLAKWLLSFPTSAVELEAEKYLSPEHELTTREDVIRGAQDIIAEWISEDADFRKELRALGFREGKIVSVLKNREKDEKAVFEMYYEYEEPVRAIVPHRVLALNRGEKEGVLKVSITFPVERMIALLRKRIIKEARSQAAPYVEEAIEDSYKRLIEPSLEREIRSELKEKAGEQAIRIFSENVRQLLLQPPIKDKVVLGIDPAYRTGCKLAVVDETGKVLDIDVIYPTPPKNDVKRAKEVLTHLLKKHRVQIIAIGNGTASRETERFVASVLKEYPSPVYYLIVNEAGASVYSASDLGRAEFPHLEVEERSAVSIARRLQDPLAEYVKIDPKSIGVGQYQHDVSQKRLNESLQFVVETVVNQIGVNVNTASASLLQYVSGLSKTVAENIIKARHEKGKFTNRMQLKAIPRLGSKTYEQAIGFLRILDGDQPLDQTAIHPESYPDTLRLLEQIDADVSEIGTESLKRKLKDVDIEKTAKQLGIGVPTLTDIIDCLVRPLRDPREELPKPLLKKEILKIDDLKAGMELQGTVRNVVDFGAFVDIGVEQDGLVHISKLADRYLNHPFEAVSVGQIVTVWVERVDVKKGRIDLTMLPPSKVKKNEFAYNKTSSR